MTVKKFAKSFVSLNARWMRQRLSKVEAAYRPLMSRRSRASVAQTSGGGIRTTIMRQRHSSSHLSPVIRRLVASKLELELELAKQSFFKQRGTGKSRRVQGNQRGALASEVATSSKLALWNHFSVAVWNLWVELQVNRFKLSLLNWAYPLQESDDGDKFEWSHALELTKILSKNFEFL